MRAGKRNDIFPASYTGDPLAAYRRNTRTAGWPSWNATYMDSGPKPAGWIDPPKDPDEDESEESEDLNTEPDPDEDSEVDAEAGAAQ